MVDIPDLSFSQIKFAVVNGVTCSEVNLSNHFSSVLPFGVAFYFNLLETVVRCPSAGISGRQVHRAVACDLGLDRRSACRHVHVAVREVVEESMPASQICQFP